MAQIMNQGSVFVVSLLLARLLGPEAYGLVGMVTIVTSFAGLFGDGGLAGAIVQRQQVAPRHLHSAFWANVVIGGVLSLLMIALARSIAALYKEPQLAALTAVSALKFFTDALNVVQLAVLHRGMQFQKLAVIQTAATVSSGLAGVCMALSGWGPWSLVGQTLGCSVMTAVLSWRLGPFRPQWAFEWRACAELFGFGSYVLGFGLVNYWARALDRLLIGRFRGAIELGIYSRAYSLMLMPLTQVSSVLGRVMFPALSAIQQDKPRVKRAYLKAVGGIALITFPMTTGAFAVADHAVLATLGHKWSAAIPIFKIFCTVGLLESIGTTVGWLFTSQGRSGLYLVVGSLFAVCCVIGFLIGIQWGMAGVAWSHLAVTLLFEVPIWAVAGRLVDIRLSEILGRLHPTLLCALTMGTFIWWVGKCLPIDLAHGCCLAIQIPIGAATYVALLASFRLDCWQEATSIWSETMIPRLKSMFEN